MGRTALPGTLGREPVWGAAALSRRWARSGATPERPGSAPLNSRIPARPWGAVC